MFGLGVFVMFLGSKFTKWMVGIGAVLVVVLGIIMFTRGAALAGIGMQQPVWGSNAQTATAQASETLTDKAAANANPSTSSGSPAGTKDVQYITSTLTAYGYPDITVQKGVPVEWTIHADKGVINGCNGIMVITAYDLEVKLKEGDNLIKFTPAESGTITYSCWMGMITGQITVDDKSAGSSGQAQTDTSAAAGNAVTPVPSQRLAAGGCCGA